MSSVAAEVQTPEDLLKALGYAEQKDQNKPYVEYVRKAKSTVKDRETALFNWPSRIRAEITSINKELEWSKQFTTSFQGTQRQLLRSDSFTYGVSSDEFEQATVRGVELSFIPSQYDITYIEQANPELYKLIDEHDLGIVVYGGPSEYLMVEVCSGGRGVRSIKAGSFNECFLALIDPTYGNSGGTVYQWLQTLTVEDRKERRYQAIAAVQQDIVRQTNRHNARITRMNDLLSAVTRNLG